MVRAEGYGIRETQWIGDERTRLTQFDMDLGEKLEMFSRLVRPPSEFFTLFGRVGGELFSCSW